MEEKVNLDSELPNIYEGFHLSIQKHTHANQECVSSYPQARYLVPIANHARASSSFINVITKSVSLLCK